MPELDCTCFFLYILTAFNKQCIMEIIVKEGRNTYSALLEENVSVNETIDEILYLMSIVFSEEQVNQAVSDIAMKLV